MIILSCPACFAEALDISGECACLIEAKTGRVLYSKNETTKHAMASTTKIMTAIIALEESSPEDIVEMSINAANTEGSSVYAEAGDKLTMKDMVYGLMLNSGNDAAVAIAEHISGDVSSFCQKMNQKAKELGAKDTNFKNPNGLYDDDHYTTAKDLAIITRYAMQNQDFCEIVSTKSKTVNIIDTGKELYFGNHNKMLWNYDGAVGVKTGYTSDTGRCLVSAAQREGCLLIAVTLDAPNDWQDHTKMLDYGFSNLEKRIVIEENQVMQTQQINQTLYDFVAEKNCILSFEKNDEKGVTINVKVPKNLTGPMNKGDKVGIAEVIVNGEVLETINIVAASDITEQPQTIQINEEKGLWEKFIEILIDFFLGK